MSQSTHLFVISDLHLGGSAPAMMSAPGHLAAFIRSLPDRADPGEAIGLVLAGDIIDFLAIEVDGRTDAFTADPARAVRKLRQAMSGPDAPVYAALRDHVVAGRSLTILVGNHDLELALPDVQIALCVELRCPVTAVHFVDDGRAWRFGQVLVEHGNRYDEANQNDWASLREIAASQSRGEIPLSTLEPSFGSEFVRDVVYKYKQTFEFIDTLQPEGVLTAYLMTALEPGFLMRLPLVVAAWRAKSLAARNRDGAPPTRPGMRSGGAAGFNANTHFGKQIDTARLDELFGIDTGEQVRRGPGTAVIREMLRPDHEGLLHMIVNRRPIPAWRLEIVQETLREMMWTDRSLEVGGDCGTYGAAAARLRRDTGARVVVMGHTHQARHAGPPDCAEYINTGTWADLVTVPYQALTTGADGMRLLEQWLTDLCLDRGVRTLVPTWAEMQVAADGTLITARLRRELPVRCT